MANDTTHVPETLDFHPTDTPRGMEFYNLSILTSAQQAELNKFKTNIVRANQIYLFQHPEIRAVLQIIMRKVLSARPSHDVQAFIGQYLKNNWEEIEAEVTTYAATLRGYTEPESGKKTLTKDDLKHFVFARDDVKAGTDAVSSSTSSATLEEAGDAEEICREIVMDIIEKIGLVVPERVRRPKIISQEDVVPADEEIFAKLFGVSSTSLVSDDADDVELDLDFNAFHEDEDQ